MADFDVDEALHLLRHGTIEVEGRLIDASNATLYCRISLEATSSICVYKPVSGERPLWDFPDGTLAGRENAAYLIDAAMGWQLIPPTVLRDGPFGPGMCQLWIDVDESVNLGELARSSHPDLRRMAVLDAVINNADRKGGHLLPTVSGRVYGVDHGVTFNVDDKLRTLLWKWRGKRLPDEALDTLAALRSMLDGELAAALGAHITTEEVAMTVYRVERLLSTGRYPMPPEDWPAVPWPPF